MTPIEIATAPYAGYAAYSGSAATLGGQTIPDIATAVQSELTTSGSVHTRYTNSEAVNAMGAAANTNSLNHDRYGDGEGCRAHQDRCPAAERGARRRMGWLLCRRWGIRRGETDFAGDTVPEIG